MWLACAGHLLGQSTSELGGVVLDRDGETPLAGALVFATGRSDPQVTDAQGRFTFGAVRPGEYTLAFTHQSLSGWGLSLSLPVTVSVGTDDPAAVVLYAPSLAEVLDLFCRVEGGTRGFAMAGRVAGVGASGEATVRLSPASSPDRSVATTRVSESGTFRFCSIRDSLVLVTAWVGDVQTDAAIVDLAAPEVGLVELGGMGVEPSTVDSVDLSYVGSGAEPQSVRGRLRDTATGAPIVDAVVSIRGRGGFVQSDPSGYFALPDVEAGPVALMIDHLAYGEPTVTIDVPARQTVVATVWLSPRPIALDGVTVTTNRALEAARRRAPYRLTIFAGRELAAAETRGARPIDVLRNAPGVRVRRDGSIELPRARCCAIFVLDGIRVDNPLGLMPLSDIESIEVLPPVEASWRYGLGGVEGAVVIFTRGKGPYRDPNRAPGG